MIFHGDIHWIDKVMKSQERIELILDSFCQYYYGHLGLKFGQWQQLKDLLVLQDEISDDQHTTAAKIIAQILENITDRYEYIKMKAI